MVAYTEHYRTTRIFQSLASADKTLQTFTYLYKAVPNPTQNSTKANWFCNKAIRKPTGKAKEYEILRVRINAGTVKIHLHDTDLAPEGVHSKRLQKTFRPSLDRVWKVHEIAWNRAACELQGWESAISEESGDHTRICLISDVFSKMQHKYWKLSIRDQKFKL